MKLFGLRSSWDSAQGLARALGIELAALEEREFEDGEFKIRPLESVRGECTIVYQTLAASAGASVNDKLVRALILAGALADAGAAEVQLVAPYLAFSRKDRRTKARDPVSTRYVAQMCEAVGIAGVVTVDVHNPAAFENAFRCPARNVATGPVFAEHFRAQLAADDRVTVVSPDAGGVRRARELADLLAAATGHEIGLGFVEKHRSEGRVTGNLFAGDVRDSAVVIVDDMICGGTTLQRAALLCREQGARSIHAAATHGLFTAGAVAALSAELVASIAVTDTVPDVRERGVQFGSRLQVIGVAATLADVLR